MRGIRMGCRLLWRSERFRFCQRAHPAMIYLEVLALAVGALAGGSCTQSGAAIADFLQPFPVKRRSATTIEGVGRAIAGESIRILTGDSSTEKTRATVWRVKSYGKSVQPPPTLPFASRLRGGAYDSVPRGGLAAAIPYGSRRAAPSARRAPPPQRGR